MSASRKAAAQPERFLVFLRHGIAEEQSAGKKDEDRSLTKEGRARMKQIARGLARALPNALAIYSSPLLRAVQTSLWVSKGYSSKAAVNTTDALAPGATKEQFLALIKAITVNRAILVGHEPGLSKNVATLVGIEVPELQKGGCYGVRLLRDGTAQLEWMLPPRILRKLG